MSNARSWAPRYNALPENHVRFTFNTTEVVDPVHMVAFANALIQRLDAAGFPVTSIVHIGEGSAIHELSVAESAANAAKTTAEIEKLQAERKAIEADTRIKNLKAIALAGGLFFAAAKLGIEIYENEGGFAAAARSIITSGSATVCEIAVGDAKCEIAFADHQLEAKGITAQASIDLAEIKLRAGDSIRYEKLLNGWDELGRIDLISEGIAPAPTSEARIVKFEGDFDLLDGQPILRRRPEDVQFVGVSEILPIEVGTPIRVKGYRVGDKGDTPIRIIPTYIRMR